MMIKRLTTIVVLVADASGVFPKLSQFSCWKLHGLSRLEPWIPITIINEYIKSYGSFACFLANLSARTHFGSFQVV